MTRKGRHGAVAAEIDDDLPVGAEGEHVQKDRQRDEAVRQQREVLLSPVVDGACDARIRLGFAVAEDGERHGDAHQLVAGVETGEQCLVVVTPDAELRNPFKHRTVGHVGGPLPLGAEPGPGLLLVREVEIGGQKERVFEAAMAAEQIADQVADLPETDRRWESLYRKGPNPSVAKPDAGPVVTDIDILVEQLLRDQALLFDRDHAVAAPWRMGSPVQKRRQHRRVAFPGPEVWVPRRHRADTARRAFAARRRFPCHERWAGSRRRSAASP